ncbi:MAG: hypothetical protein IKH51_11795 [Clostridia bacterium]|nr:hypothetical protein [Clostridia bacterium]
MKNIFKALLCALLAGVMIYGASCTEAPAETETQSVTETETETETEKETETETETETEEITTVSELTQTDTPVIEATAPISVHRTIIYGTAEPGSVIRSVIDGVEELNECNDKYFYIEVRTEKKAKVYLYATAPGKSESKPAKTDVSTSEEARSVFGGRNSRIFYSPTLGFLTGSEADQSSLDSLSAYIAGKTITEIQKATGKETKLIYAIIPDPATAYYDEQRDYIAEQIPEGHKSAMESFVETVSGAHKDVYALDLLSVMRAHKSERIYFSTDTHYSELGAYYAYLEIMSKVKETYPDAVVKTVENGDYTIEYNDVPGGDMCGMIGMTMNEVVPFFVANFEDTGSYYISKRNDGIKSAGFGPSNWQRDSQLSGSNNPTAYFLGDSYGCYILPFIGANFSKVWTNEGVLWNYSLDKNILEQNKPDYVILVVCQRNISPNFMEGGNVINAFSTSVAGFAG